MARVLVLVLLGVVARVVGAAAGCSAHAECGDGSFCAEWEGGVCEPLSECHHGGDAIDGACPPGASQVDCTNAESAVAQVFPKVVRVFDLATYATEDTPDAKVLHAAAVMAKYLDNDEDGEVDDPAVLQSMLQERAAMMMAATERAFESLASSVDDETLITLLGCYKLQNLGADETVIGYNAASQRFDASLEEVLHLISDYGYAKAHPAKLGYSDSELSAAMDTARGGSFQTVPNTYPENAWYTYYDSTCSYSCMGTEYIYWALTTKLGAQTIHPQRCQQIYQEWRPCNATELEATDTAVWALLIDSSLKLPTVLPDGTYSPVTLVVEATADGANGGGDDDDDDDGAASAGSPIATLVALASALARTLLVSW